MKSVNKQEYIEGLQGGIPIALGYFAVSFSLGIAARNAGLTAFQATFMSITNVTSAGQFAGISAICACASYLEIALIQLVINLRYLLMSCALSQKFDPKFPLIHRFLVGYGITDEIFGISSARKKLNPFYSYGAISVAVPGWALGTCLGVIMGNVLPINVVSALSVALYAMFIAIIIPPARDNKVLLGIVVVSMLASVGFTYAPLLKEISSGFRVMILTVVIAFVAAILFPVEEEDEKDAV